MSEIENPLFSWCLRFLVGVSAVLKAIQAAATRVELLSALAADSWLVVLKTDTYVLPWQCVGLQAKILHSFLGRQLILLPVRTES